MEKNCLKTKEGYCCPDCNAKLHSLIGVAGRMVCRSCEQTLIVDSCHEHFDENEWAKVNKDKNGNAVYGRLTWVLVKTDSEGNKLHALSKEGVADPRSIGSKSEFKFIEHHSPGSNYTF